jgi:hypothetical protein
VARRARRPLAPATRLERAAIVTCGLLVAVGAIIALSGFFAGQDQAGISGAPVGPGQAFRDLGDRHLAPGAPHPAYNSTPPTSGPHLRAPVTRDAAPLSDDQLLTALAAGDVVLAYATRTPPAGLAQLARAVASPFTAALAASGQAVVLGRRSDVSGVVALAWAHLLRAAGPQDPRLLRFAQVWLGRGAPGR